MEYLWAKLLDYQILVSNLHLRLGVLSRSRLREAIEISYCAI